MTIRPNSSTTYDFSVKACSNARIALKTAGVSSEEMYTLILGDDENTVTKLVDQTNKVITQRPTPNILACYEAKFFHLSVSIFIHSLL